MKKSTKTPAGKKIVHGQPSWRLATRTIEAFVTELGGHLGPVTFDRQDRKIQPFSVAPWAGEKPDFKLPPILRVLRGDFFCLPFGGNATIFNGEQHPVHGETANAKWRLEGLDTKGERKCLHLSHTTNIRPGQVDKRIFLVEGHDAVYCRHTISGMAGPMDLGHHAMLKFPDAPGSGVLSLSPFVYGQVFPEPFERPESGGYNWLKAGARFDSLERVPTLTGETTDLTSYPARRGFEDLVMVVSDPNLPFAWTAVTFPREGCVWFALKDPKILRNTVLWLSNGGRHYPPWSGRHVNVMGLEEVTANFHYGLAESVKPNIISGQGHPTCVVLDPERPLVVPYIMGIAKIPEAFARVARIEPAQTGINLISPAGQTVFAPLALDFLRPDSACQ
jgi:hypothetical protein